MANYVNLKNPPVAIALFQLKYTGDIKLSDFLTYENSIKHNLPIRREKIEVGIDLGKTSIHLGETKIEGTTNAEIKSYVFISTDQKTKLEVSIDTITFTEEHQYIGWENFSKDFFSLLDKIRPILERVQIKRTSVRFINRFTLQNFENPQKYFNTMVTSKNPQSLYPIHQYGFRLVMDVPDTEIYSIVNHNVETISNGQYSYTFDIDVLDKQNLVYDIGTLSLNLEKLREIKNKIFFESITQETIDLCN